MGNNSYDVPMVVVIFVVVLFHIESCQFSYLGLGAF